MGSLHLTRRLARGVIPAWLLLYFDTRKDIVKAEKGRWFVRNVKVQSAFESLLIASNIRRLTAEKERIGAWLSLVYIRKLLDHE